VRTRGSAGLLNTKSWILITVCLCIGAAGAVWIWRSRGAAHTEGFETGVVRPETPPSLVGEAATPAPNGDHGVSLARPTKAEYNDSQPTGAPTPASDAIVDTQGDVTSDPGAGTAIDTRTVLESFRSHESQFKGRVIRVAQTIARQNEDPLPEQHFAVRLMGDGKTSLGRLGEFDVFEAAAPQDQPWISWTPMASMAPLANAGKAVTRAVVIRGEPHLIFTVELEPKSEVTVTLRETAQEAQVTIEGRNYYIVASRLEFGGDRWIEVRPTYGDADTFTPAQLVFTGSDGTTVTQTLNMMASQ